MVRRAIFFVGFSILALTVLAQSPYTSKNGWFQVNQKRACAPFTITIVNTNASGNGGCTGASPCLMSFDGTNNCPPGTCQNATTFTYNTPGLYKLQVVYQSIGVDSIMVRVDPNVQPAFDIYTCAGDQVQINITDKTYDLYDVDFKNDASVDLTVPTGANQTANYNYGAPGSYNISVKGKKLNALANCTAKVQAFSAVATLPTPSITSLAPLTPTDATSLKVAFTPQTNIEYKSEIAFNNSTNFQSFQTLYKVNSVTKGSLDQNNNFYCFRLGSFDPCVGTNIYSIPICSHKFNLALTSGSDQLTWQTSSTNVTGIQVKRNNAVLANLAGTATSYNDNAVVCKTDYTYQLVSSYAGGATSTSLQKTGKAFLTVTPTAITNTSAVVNAAQVDLSWVPASGFTVSSYSILRSPVSGSLTPLAASSTSNYTDAAYNGNSCYQINYTDNCDNQSAAGIISCPIKLSGSANNADEISLQWSDYTGWNLGVKNYTIQKLNSQGQVLQTINNGTSTTYLETPAEFINQIVYYKIIANPNEASVSTSISNLIKVEKGVNLFYPTAFNPQSTHAENKTFIVRGHFIRTLTLQIFDRWGGLVFYSDKDEAWDGKRDGITMPEATYVWTAEGTDQAGRSFKKAGTVVLIR